ncbi:MAG: hypothetical protein ACRD0C_03430 [Acidimicrobiia bacterium]
MKVAWRVRAALLALSVVIAASGCSDGGEDASDASARAVVEQSLPFRGEALEARLRPGSDPVEARRLAEALALLGAPAVEVDYAGGTVHVMVGKPGWLGRLADALRASPVVESVGPSEEPAHD